MEGCEPDMKKRRIALLALLLCLAALCGCVRGAALPKSTPSAVPAAHTPAPETDEAAATLPPDDPFGREAEEEKRIETLARGEEIPVFSDMPYERPDLTELETLIERAEAAMNGGAPYDEVEAMLDDCYAFYYHYDTMYTLADIRSCLDLTDGYYAEEYLWCAENYTLADQAMDGLCYACAASRLAAALEENYFWEGFTEQYSDESESIYTDETVALMQEESNLIAEYRALSAEPTVVFRGQTELIDVLLERLDGEDYNEAVEAYYEQVNGSYADLYIRLIAVREKLAAALGYDSYEEMQYLYGYERDYTPEQAEAYLEDIKTYMVPLYRSMTRSYLPVNLGKCSESRLQEVLKQMAADFGGGVEEAYDFMLRYELCDLGADSRKANMSFETYLLDWEAPFVFLNAAGTTEDILSYAHEFGHFCDAYVNLNAYETIDLAEVYSQAMEYLVLTRLDEQLSASELRQIARYKMIDTVEMYVEQAAFAEFEHRVYALGSENLDAGTLNDVARQTAKDYGFYLSWYDAFYSLSWVDVPHFFEQPFYVVSYPISNDLAMQIFDLERAEPGAGLQRYLDNLEHDYSGMMGLAEEGGFESPFAPGRVEAIAAAAREILGL